MRASWRWRRQAEHGELLAHRGRRGGLAVGVGEQRHVAQVAGHRGEPVDQGGRAGQPDLVHGALDHHGVREVVDVLAGAAEVDQLGEAGVVGARRDGGEPLLEEVLDRLDVVLGHPLGGRHLVDLGRAEPPHDVAQRLLLLGGEPSHAGHDLVLGEVDEPLDLDVHPRPVERRLGEVVDERGDDAAVAPVEGTQGDRGLGVGEAGGCREAGRAVGAGHAPILPERQGCGCRVATWRSLSPGRAPPARRGRARRSPGSRR